MGFNSGLKGLKANLYLSTLLMSYVATENVGWGWGWGVEVQFCSFLTSALGGGPWSISHSGRFSPRTEPRNQLNRRLGGFQSRYGRFEEKKIPGLSHSKWWQMYVFWTTKSPHSSLFLGHVPMLYRRSQWPRGQRRRSAAARLLRSRVRIPPGAWMFVCCECCVLSGRGLCDELITRPEGS